MQKVNGMGFSHCCCSCIWYNSVTCNLWATIRSKSIETLTSCDHIEFQISQCGNSLFFLSTTSSWQRPPSPPLLDEQPPPILNQQPPPILDKWPPLSMNDCLPPSTKNGLLPPSMNRLVPSLTNRCLPPSTNGRLLSQALPYLNKQSPPPSLNERHSHRSMNSCLFTGSLPQWMGASLPQWMVPSILNEQLPPPMMNGSSLPWQTVPLSLNEQSPPSLDEWFLQSSMKGCLLPWWMGSPLPWWMVPLPWWTGPPSLNERFLLSLDKWSPPPSLNEWLPPSLSTNGCPPRWMFHSWLDSLNVYILSCNTCQMSIPSSSKKWPATHPRT